MKSKGLIKTFIFTVMVMLFTFGVKVKAEEVHNPFEVKFKECVQDVSLLKYEEEFILRNNVSEDDIEISNCVGNCEVSIDGSVSTSMVGNYPITYTVTDDKGTIDESDDEVITLIRSFYVINTFNFFTIFIYLDFKL